MAYFSVFIPTKTDAEECDKTTVFTCKDEALKLLKDHKEARLKVFKNHEDALKFSELGFESCPIKTSGLKSPTTTGSPLEKPAFRAPTKQDLIQFRKTIEEDKYESVELTIWENPRYLVNSGDTPTSLKEGTRYNALHVCAIHSRPRIASLILQTINEYRFVERLHGKKNKKICQEVSEILLDYYLNMPEKGRSETPLHLAVKYGSLKVVEVLTAYPQCKMTPNSEMMYPKDIVCSRMDNPNKELKDKIVALLSERYYVPVIRSVDNSLPPAIGEPFSQTDPPELNTDPLSPEREIQAFAGPMNKEQAETFRKRWKTPPRTGKSPVSKLAGHNSFISNSPLFSPMNSIYSTPKRFANNINSSTPIINWSKDSSIPAKLNLEDRQNGNLLEKNAIENNNELQETCFPFPVSTPVRHHPKRKEILLGYRDNRIDLDETELNKSTMFDTPDKSVYQNSFKERHLKLSDTEKGLELIGRELAKEQNVDWREYWDFLGSFVDISSPSGLEQLENYLQKEKEKEKQDQKRNDSISDLCKAVKMMTLQNDSSKKINNERNTILNHVKPIEQVENSVDVQQSNIAPYSCVEKSLQVYAKRMTKTFMHNIDSIVSILDSFNSELTRLKSLVCSFKNDSRFTDVDFSLVHSRFANLIVYYLRNADGCSDNLMQKAKTCIEEILESKTRPEKAEHMHCVAKHILRYSNQTGDRIVPENLKTEAICVDTWRTETQCNCQWNVERRRNILSKRNKRMELSQVTRKLFESAENNFQQEKGSEEHHKPENENKIDSDNESSDDNDENDEDLFCDIEEEQEEEELFWSDLGSDDGDDVFYTPPVSPSLLELDVSDDAFESYNTYLLGPEPTKRDLDVINALFDVEIDRLLYPHIHRWRAAVLRHSNEERDNFPSPSVVKSRMPVVHIKSPLVRRSLLKQSRLPLAKSNELLNHFRNSSSIIENSSPIVNNSCNLSYMNVSSDFE